MGITKNKTTNTIKGGEKINDDYLFNLVALCSVFTEISQHS